MQMTTVTIDYQKKIKKFVRVLRLRLRSARALSPLARRSTIAALPRAAMHNAGYTMHYIWCRVHDAGYKVHNAKCTMQNIWCICFSFGIWFLGFQLCNLRNLFFLANGIVLTNRIVSCNVGLCFSFGTVGQALGVLGGSQKKVSNINMVVIYFLW